MRFQLYYQVTRRSAKRCIKFRKIHAASSPRLTATAPVLGQLNVRVDPLAVLPHAPNAACAAARSARLPRASHLIRSLTTSISFRLAPGSPHPPPPGV